MYVCATAERERESLYKLVHAIRKCCSCQRSRSLMFKRQLEALSVLISNACFIKKRLGTSRWRTEDWQPAQAAALHTVQPIHTIYLNQTLSLREPSLAYQNILNKSSLSDIRMANIQEYTRMHKK